MTFTTSRHSNGGGNCNNGSPVEDIYIQKGSDEQQQQRQHSGVGLFGWLATHSNNKNQQERSSSPSLPSQRPISPLSTTSSSSEYTGDDPDDDHEHYHSLQHPSHVPTPKTICLFLDDDDDDDDDELDGNHENTSNTNKKKNWLADEIIPSVGGAIVDGVSKLTLFLGGEAGVEQIEVALTHAPAPAGPPFPVSEESEKKIRISENIGLQDRYCDSLGAKYCHTKRNELLSKPSSVVTKVQRNSSYSRDDTDVISRDDRYIPIFDSSFRLGENPNDDDCQLPLELSVQTESFVGSPETSLQRKWMIENAFNLHSTRASQRILDDDTDCILSISLITDDGDDTDDDSHDGSDTEVGNDDDDSCIILKDVPPSTFWDVYDTMEEISRSRMNPRKHNHKGRFTGTAFPATQ